MHVLELTNSCQYQDGTYPVGFICRSAKAEECEKFMKRIKKEGKDTIENILQNGGMIVYLNGKLRILERQNFKIVGKTHF